MRADAGPRHEELLDGDSLTAAETGRALDDLARANRWLLGNRALLRALAGQMTKHASGGAVRLLDVGTGSGDAAHHLARALDRRALTIRVVGVDRKLGHLLHGQRRGFEQRRVVADAARLPFRDGTFDWALSTLFFHHFDGAANRAILSAMATVADRVAVVDLRRTPFGRTWVEIALRLLGVGRVALHDGRLSIRRAWRFDEVRRLASKLGPIDLRRRFPLRFSLILEPDPARREPRSVAR